MWYFVKRLLKICIDDVNSALEVIVKFNFFEGCGGQIGLSRTTTFKYVSYCFALLPQNVRMNHPRRQRHFTILNIVNKRDNYVITGIYMHGL